MNVLDRILQRESEFLDIGDGQRSVLRTLSRLLISRVVFLTFSSFSTFSVLKRI